MLSTIHPIVKLAVCIAWLLAAMLVFDARFQLACILLPALALAILGPVSPLRLLVLSVPFALFGLGFLTTSLLFHRESDFALHVAREAAFASPAFSAGMTLFLRALACGAISMVFALTTDPDGMVRALMATFGLPPRIGYSLFAVMQLVPDLASEAQQMRLARAMKSGRPPRRIPGPFELFGLIVPLLAFAIRRAGRTAVAMEARGLSPDGPRTLMNAPRFRRRDWAFGLLAMGALATLMLLALRFPAP
ncbi:energy-coupling factor transporter transmembrane component T [Microvirga thermotolerans]|uniref:Energy-coupling factor transporter transmembrane protein EcfT n=1 Tax=Microvirga thermotolerans TaxID=2651334 RepID=A0A5P9JVI0_9HYPH|nr:energy-coupling factor transporter transmembrane component T [Microvirga thermotolerans]QFU16189.1 energy-coupling factor transporter transmembrane protein EcfT [Microvirga thermotolerans]